MTAQSERALPSLADTCSGCIALVAVAIGVLGLSGTSPLRKMLESWIDIHALFGILVCGLVLSRYRGCVQHPTRMAPADIRLLSRHLSRIVYLLLYVVVGLRETIGIVDGVPHGGAFDFNLFDAHFRSGPDYAGWNPKDDFQLFLATGLLGLIIVRVLAFRLWWRDVAPRPETYP
jgi:cytochrome b561